MIKPILLLLTLLIYLPNISVGQKTEELQKRVNQLETRIKSLETQVRLHKDAYNHDKFEMSVIRSRLALEANRNFTYFGFIYEGEANTMNGKGFQRVMHFSGYHSASQQNQNLQSDQSSYLKSVRQNLQGIKRIILDGHTEPTKVSDEYTLYPIRLIINYYDNSEAGEPLISADTVTKSLKVRINGILQEIGWD